MSVRPPIMAASEGSVAIAATLTRAPGGDAQLDALHVSAERELSRLVQAGITMTASTSRLAALGESISGIQRRNTQAITSQQLLPDLRYTVLFASYSHSIVLQDMIFSCGRLHNSQSAMQGNLRSSGEVHTFDVMVAAERSSPQCS